MLVHHRRVVQAGRLDPVHALPKQRPAETERKDGSPKIGQLNSARLATIDRWWRNPKPYLIALPQRI